MYLEMAEEEDKKLAESWQGDADGILIFVRLYLLVPCLTPTHHTSFVDPLRPGFGRLTVWTKTTNWNASFLVCLASTTPKVVKEPLRGLDDWQKLRLLETVIRLSDRTFSSNVLPDQVKRRRVDICVSAIDLVDTPEAFPEIARKLTSEDQYSPAQSTDIVDSVRRWGNRKGDDTTLVQAMFSIVVARVQRHDDSWFILASEELGIPETFLREYAAHGDSLSLAILIYVTIAIYPYLESLLAIGHDHGRSEGSFEIQYAEYVA